MTELSAQELLDRAIVWAKSAYPDSTIVTEMSVADWGGARLDLGVITDTDIVGIEIKGHGDGPSRLELQGIVYPLVCRRMWLLCSPSVEDKCLKKRPPGWGLLKVVDGKVAPARVRTYADNTRASTPREFRGQCAARMCGTLWRDELYDIARLNGVTVSGRALVGPLTEALCDQMPTSRLHDAMVDQLRRRVWRKPVINNRVPAPASQPEGTLI